MWDADVCNAAVAFANAAFTPLPPWMPLAYPITVAQVQHHIVQYLSQFAGGFVSPALLAPNNLQQYGQVQQAIGYLMLNPFVQAISGGPGRFPLARIFVMADGQRQTRGVGMPPRVPLGATAAFM